MANGDEPDLVLLEQALHGVDPGAPEELKRFFLWRHENELDSLHVVSAEVGRSHERELVGRQRPRGAPGDDECDSMDVAGDRLGEDPANRPGVGRAAERLRSRYGRDGIRPDRDEEHVVRDRTDGRPRLVCGDVDSLQLAEGEARASIRSERAQLVVPRLSPAEGLRDRERAVPEVRLGAEQLDVDGIRREGTQRERRLERRDTAAGDEDVGHRQPLVTRLARSVPCLTVFALPAGPPSALGRARAADNPRRATQARSRAWSASIAAVDAPSATATSRRELSASASGTSWAATIHSIAPPAKPSPRGTSPSKRATKR